MTEIENLLPHRFPFLFVDEIVEAGNEKIIARHVFTEKEFFFQGHYPDHPVVPGIILVETMAQSGAAGLRKLGVIDPSGLFLLAAIDKVKFRRQVRPLEEVRSEIMSIDVSLTMIKQSGRAYVGDELAAEAEWICLIH